MASTRISKPIKFIEISDVHLGHHKTKTPKIIDGLYKLLPEGKETSELDLIIIAGDLFDRLLQKNDEHMWLIELWAMWLLKMCAKHNIVLRVLEGTPSHDWKQSKMFMTYNQGGEWKADVRFVEDLEYEYHEGLGLGILYLPDEWHPDHDHCFKEAKRVLAEAGEEKADIIIMHGQFEYQLPEHVGIEFHNSAAWESIVRDFIFCGHVHQHSQKGKILVAGSFDRLKHGEEEPKGYIRGKLMPNGRHEVRFVENTYAQQYVTIDCRDLPVYEAMALVEKTADKLPSGTFIRIEANSDDNIAAGIPFLKEKYPQHYWDNPKIHARDILRVDGGVLATERYAVVDLTKQNLPGLLKERLVNKLSGEKLDRAMALLDWSL